MICMGMLCINVMKYLGHCGALLDGRKFWKNCSHVDRLQKFKEFGADENYRRKKLFTLK